MYVFDGSKLASFDAATWQIVVVGWAGVAVAAFVAAVVEIISFAHFELAFETNCSVWALWASRSSLLSWSSCSFISRIFSPFSLNHSIASPHLLLFFSFFPSSFSVSSYLFLVWLNLPQGKKQQPSIMLLSPDPALLLIKTPSAATALKSLTSFSSVHTIIDVITNSDWCISIPAVSFSNLFLRQSSVARLSCCCVFRWWASTLLQFLFHYPYPCFQGEVLYELPLWPCTFSNKGHKQ